VFLHSGINCQNITLLRAQKGISWLVKMGALEGFFLLSDVPFPSNHRWSLSGNPKDISLMALARGSAGHICTERLDNWRKMQASMLEDICNGKRDVEMVDPCSMFPWSQYRSYTCNWRSPRCRTFLQTSLSWSRISQLLVIFVKSIHVCKSLKPEWINNNFTQWPL